MPDVFCPTYPTDLRAMVRQMFGEGTALPALAVPGGTLGARVRQIALVESEQETVWCPGLCASQGRATDPQSFLLLALPYRGVLGTLLDLSELDLPPAGRRAFERSILSAYHWNHYRFPVAPAVLRLVKELHLTAPHESLTAWLDDARRRVVHAPMAELASRRKHFRIAALLRGARGVWRDRTVAAAEFLIDVMTLARHADEDVRRARALRTACDSSLSLAVAHLDRSAGFDFEASLEGMLIPPLVPEDMPEPEREAVNEFARRRRDYWRDGLLTRRARQTPARRPSGASSTGASESARPQAATGTAPETARETYRRLRATIALRLQGDVLVRELSVIGLAHMLGVRQSPVLVCGATGSGKTTAIRALAEAIGRPFLSVDCSELTGTGWRGVDLPILLRQFLDSSTEAKRGVVFLDEADKVRILSSADGNSAEAKVNLQASMLACMAGQPVTPDDGEQFDTAGLLVFLAGSFGGVFKAPPTTEDLVRWGFSWEFAGRIGQRLVTQPLTRNQIRHLLREGEMSVKSRLLPVAEAAGVRLLVSDEAYDFAISAAIRRGTDFRSLAEWLLSAARRRLSAALEDPQELGEQLTVTPDDIDGIRPTGPGGGRDDEPEAERGAPGQRR